jgi:hypothetical protein
MDYNCVNFTSDNQLVLWGNNSTDLIINVQACMWPPVITYNEKLITNGNSSVLHYIWCGPMILIVKEFAKRINAK